MDRAGNAIWYLDKTAAVHWISVTHEIVFDSVGDVNHLAIKEDAQNGRVLVHLESSLAGQPLY